MRRFLLSLLIASGVSGPATAQVAPDLVRQIEALQAEKAARTPVQRKLSSQLLYEARRRRGLPAAPGAPFLRTDLELDRDGTLLLDVRSDDPAAAAARVEALGGEVIFHSVTHQALRARLRLDAVEALAALPSVHNVRPADRAFVHAPDVSEGDAAHGADVLRASLGVDGSGVSVGVLSDGVDALTSLQASGDLPAYPDMVVLDGQAGSGSEGTAMLEIVHDLAPGARLLFATAFTSQASFAANILALRAAGADVIVDDVGYFAEAVFQDDDVAAAVDCVTAGGENCPPTIPAGALYFSAAGNSGNLDDGTAGVWEGDFVASGTTVGGNPVHDFGGGTILNTIQAASPYLYSLHWSDPKWASCNDYDLYLTNNSGSVLFAASTDVQDCDDAPFEAVPPLTGGKKLMVVRKAGASRMLHLNANRGRLAVVTAGQTSGHSAAREAFSVAAVDVRDAGSGGVFDGSEPVETYSSDGPRRVFYEADGSPITSGNFSSSGGELRQKPDLAAADCVSTATPGFATFCGTSAAAPHAAAVASLLLEHAPWATRAQIRDALETTALDIEAPGVDRDSGAGLVDAPAAAASLVLVECADGVDDDGDGLVDLDDPGCDDADDPSERSGALACDDGQDNDGDGLADFVPDGDGDGIADPPGDPACQDPTSPLEDPGCDDDLDNDGDGAVDWDGDPEGLGDGPAAVDPQCAGRPWRSREAPGSCGLGFEAALALLALHGLRSRRRARHAPPASRSGSTTL